MTSLPPVSRWNDTRETVALALPLMLSHAALNLFAVTSLQFAGELGTVELAGASLAFGIVNLALALLGGIDGAAMAMIRAAMGASRRHVRSARQHADHGLITAFLCCLGLLPVLLHVDDISIALGQDPAVARAAREAMSWLAWMPLPYLSFRVLRALAGAAGRINASVVAVVLGGITNTLVGWLLVTGGFGAPPPGLEGIGLAALAGALVMLAAVAWSLIHDRRLARLVWLKRSLSVPVRDIGTMWKHSVSIGLTLFFEASIFYAALIAVGNFGAQQLVAHAIAMQVVSLAFKVPSTLGQASTIRVARARGAGDVEEMARVGWAAFGLAAVFAVSMASILLFAPSPIISFFSDGKAPDAAGVSLLATQFLFFAGLFQIGDALQGVLSGMLRGMQDTLVPMLLAALGYWGALPSHGLCPRLRLRAARAGSVDPHGSRLGHRRSASDPALDGAHSNQQSSKKDRRNMSGQQLNATEIWRLAGAKSTAFFELSDRVWDTPEIKFQEDRSVAEHIAMLEKEGFRIAKGVAGLPTAVVGEGGEGGPVQAIAEGAALMSETRFEFKQLSGDGNLVGNKPLEDAMYPNLVRLGGPGFDDADRALATAFQKTFSSEDIRASYGRFGAPVRENEPLSDDIYPRDAADELFVGSADVGTVSWIVPTVQCRAACYAVGTPGHSWQLVAQGKAPAAHKGLALAAKAMAGVGTDLLTQPELLAAAKKEFAAFREKNPFRSPIGDEIEPALDMAR